MLENTLGGSKGSKERVEEPGRPHLSLVTHSCTGGGGGGGDFAICGPSFSCEDTRRGAKCHMPRCHPALEMQRSRVSEALFSFISRLLVHSCEHTHTHVCVRVCVYCLSPIFRTFKGSSMPLSANNANLSRNDSGEVTFPRQPVNKQACGRLSIPSGLRCQFPETLCRDTHTPDPPYRCWGCLSSSWTLSLFTTLGRHTSPSSAEEPLSGFIQPIADCPPEELIMNVCVQQLNLIS